MICQPCDAAFEREIIQESEAALAMMEIENREVPAELRRLILHGEAVAFIGSGPSAEIYGRWYEVVNLLCARCGVDRHFDKQTEGRTLLRATLEAKNADRDGYYVFLGDHFGRPEGKRSGIYTALLALPFSCYLTTNFDPLLALQARARQPEHQLPVHFYPALDRKKMGTRSIHYLHGYIEENGVPPRGSVVFAADEIEHAYRDNGPLMDLLIPTFRDDAVVFIGCELQEPPMARVFDICEEHREERRELIARQGRRVGELPPKYILLGKPEDQDAEDMEADMARRSAHYADIGIKPVWYDPDGDHAALRYALEELAQLPRVPADYSWRGGTDVR